MHKNKNDYVSDTSGTKNVNLTASLQEPHRPPPRPPLSLRHERPPPSRSRRALAPPKPPSVPPILIDEEPPPRPPKLPSVPPILIPQQERQQIITIDIDYVDTEDNSTCLKETRKTCCLWTVYCTCVNKKYLFYTFFTFSIIVLSILEIHMAFKYLNAYLCKWLTIDGILSICMLICYFIIEFMFYRDTFQHIMIQRNDLLCFKLLKFKQAVYLFFIVIKIIETSIILKVLIKTISNKDLLFIMSFILFIQCIIVIYLCFTIFKQTLM